MKTIALLAAASLLATALPVSQPAAAAGDFLSRFDGQWSGSGEVIREESPSKPNAIKCSIAVDRAANSFSMDGDCRAAVIFTRSIGASLDYDPGSGVFTGVFTGSKKGPAQLEGRQKGNSLVLNMTWRKPIFGDRSSVLTLTNTGNGTFSLAITDQVEGRAVKTTDVSFHRA
ncbi:hypothetical protein [Consotaella aegiceratis]|uniref:hypothetical protein n=1 Tax=Consotaella aegiceratis TaxID=3097961 RepID=UPI002F41B2AC